MGKEKAACHIRALTLALPLGLSSWELGSQAVCLSAYLCCCLKNKMLAAPYPRVIWQARCRDAALPGLLQVSGIEVFTLKYFSTQVRRLISLPSQSLESNTECIGCLQQQLNSCTLVNLPRNPPAADTLLARHSGLRFTGAPLSDCRWYCCARVQMCYQIAVFIFSMLCLICQIGFNPVVFRMFPTSTKAPKVDWTPKQMPGIFVAVRLLFCCTRETTRA